jgi:hypothetical protein
MLISKLLKIRKQYSKLIFPLILHIQCSSVVNLNFVKFVYSLESSIKF